MADVWLPFIGAMVRGGGRSRKVNSGRWVRFEVNHFKDEGEAAGTLQFVVGEEERRHRRLSFSTMKGRRRAVHGAVAATAEKKEMTVEVGSTETQKPSWVGRVEGSVLKKKKKRNKKWNMGQNRLGCAKKNSIVFAILFSTN
jgi:hypothetical protein